MNVLTLMIEPAPDRVLIARATFVFTDIVGSTALAEKVGDERWADVLRAHNRVVREMVERSGGEEISFLGDGFLLMFADPASAWICALRLQRAIETLHALFPDAAIELRIGIHCGDAYREGPDVFGRAVHLASRIADEAGPGEIAVSEACRELVGAEASRFWRARERTLKGLAGRHRLFLTRPALRLQPVA